MAYRINHIHLKSPDPRRTADWYVGAFGFTIPATRRASSAIASSGARRRTAA
jgi:catechol-2,3-dioxygenase